MCIVSQSDTCFMKYTCSCLILTGLFLTIWGRGLFGNLGEYFMAKTEKNSKLKNWF